jgi:hypothetical protein
MRTHEEAADLIVGQATCLEALGQLGIQLLIGEVGKIARLALLGALDEHPEHLAEEFRRADRRSQLSAAGITDDWPTEWRPHARRDRRRLNPKTTSS